MSNNPFSIKKENNEVLNEKQKEFIENNVDKQVTKTHKNNKVFLHFPISRELKAKIESYAKSVDRSQNYVMRKALEEWFENQTK